MRRLYPLIALLLVAGCATQELDRGWRLSEKQAIAIGNRALAANGLDPSKYRWHQLVWRYTDTRDWYILFSARYPGPGGEDVLVVLNDESQKATVKLTGMRWSGGARAVVPEFGGVRQNGPFP
ncbi:MAG: hypothetical protein IRY93_02790 [Chthoniobacterales bacterium]|nr:hypothetical protein [Chthoniobacterales bacterium]